MRIAHLSDLHLLSLEGAVPFRLLNKRLTGYANLRFHRKSVHRPFAAEAAAREIRRLQPDHVVITGDVSNLALEVEFGVVRSFLDETLGLPPDQVSLVPGNHDAYTMGSHRTQRFGKFFAPYISFDIAEIGSGTGFSYVRLRGSVAFVGLSTAVPRPPFVASGALGEDQLRALEKVLDHPEVRSRTLVLLQHHPWHNPPGFAQRLLQGLSDATAEGILLRRVERGLLLHGHLHRRIHRTLTTERGHIDAIGATSASLLHESDERMAGFNLYEIREGMPISATSHRLVLGDESRQHDDLTFRQVEIPRT